MADFEFNDQQKEVADLCVKWYLAQYKQTFEISGPAGSGKTSIVEYIISRLGLDDSNVLYMAFVGKAAMMLSLRGNMAKTIHASIYNPSMKTLFDADGNVIIKNNREVKYRGFELKKSLGQDIKLLVVDEGSMVNEQFKNDILSFGIPTIVLGDLNQLPPVFGDPAFLIKPDYILTKVERQAANDPIIMLSQMAIKGEDIDIGKYGERCLVIPKELLTDDYLKLADIILCGRNATRQNITNYYRQNILGIKSGGVPIIGEKVICRQNNWGLIVDGKINLINGLIGYIDNMYLETYNKKSINIDFRPEFPTEEIFVDVPMDFKYLFMDMVEAASGKMSYYNKFQFAYAITAHLAQGSQYDNVLVYDERLGSQDYYNKWLYTCITRAIKGLVIAKSPTPKKKNIFLPHVA